MGYDIIFYNSFYQKYIFVKRYVQFDTGGGFQIFSKFAVFIIKSFEYKI